MLDYRTIAGQDCASRTSETEHSFPATFGRGQCYCAGFGTLPTKGVEVRIRKPYRGIRWQHDVGSFDQERSSISLAACSI
jgi:hypothetical protein